MFYLIIKKAIINYEYFLCCNILFYLTLHLKLNMTIYIFNMNCTQHILIFLLLLLYFKSYFVFLKNIFLIYSLTFFTHLNLLMLHSYLYFKNKDKDLFFLDIFKEKVRVFFDFNEASILNWCHEDSKFKNLNYILNDDILEIFKNDIHISKDSLFKKLEILNNYRYINRPYVIDYITENSINQAKIYYF